MGTNTKYDKNIMCIALMFCMMFQSFTFAFAADITASEPTKPSFVIRQGDKLKLNGSEFRFVGVNSWNMTYNGLSHIPSEYEINDWMKTFNEMGVTTVRFFPATLNGALTLEPQLNVWNEGAWKQLDYVIKTAAEYNVRLIIPFVDNWGSSTSGKKIFTGWRGIDDENQFYSNETVINDFKEFIRHMLNRVNIYTGVAYKDDPTILAWETGNELSPPANWTKDVAAYVKSMDSNHLIMDGNYGVSKKILDDPNIDIVSDHYYGNDDYSARLRIDRLASHGKKALIVGEFGDSSSNENNNYSNLLQEAVSDGTSGIMIWSLYGHSDNGGFIQHGDDNQLHFPGDTPQMRETCEIIRNYAFQIRGLTVPPRSIPEAPYIFSANRLNDNKVLLRWKGTMGADTYTVWRATSADGPWEVIAANVKETGYIYNYRNESADTGYIDNQAASGQSYYYKMTASNESGTSDTSNTIGPVAPGQNQSQNLVQDGSFEPEPEQNLIQNPGFESGNSSWNLSRVFTVTNEDKYSGSYSIKLAGENSWESITQTVNVTPQTQYKLTFYAKINGGALFKVFDGNWNSPIVDNIWASDTGGVWKKIEVSFNSGNNSTIIIYGTDAGGTGYFDDFSLVQDNNLIQNPGFESGNSSWNLSRVFTVTNEDKYSGSYSIKLAGENSWESITHTVNVTPQTQYKLTFYAKINGGALFKVFDGNWNAPIVDNIWASDTGGVWKKIEVSFNSGNNSTIIIYGTDAGGIGYFDDFSLVNDNTKWIMGRVYSITDEDKHSGNYSLKLTGERSWESFTQTVNVKPKTDYILSFYAKTDSKELLKLYDKDQFIISEYYTEPGDEWKGYKIIFNSGEHSEVTIYGTDAGGTGYFDDFELNPLDENLFHSQGEVSLSQNSLFIKKGDKKTIIAAVYDGFGNAIPDATVQWSDIDPNIASVEVNGNSVDITGTGSGNVVLKASYGSLQPAHAKVTVMQLSSLNLVLMKTKISVGDRVELSVIGALQDDSVVDLTGAQLQIVSSDKQVAKVKHRELVGEKEGEAILTASATVYGRTVSSRGITVDVFKEPVPQALVADVIRIDIRPGESLNAGVKVVDQGGNAMNSVPVIWKSSNTNIVTIDNNGMLTGINPGFATITAEYGQLTPVQIDIRVMVPVVKKTLSDDANLEELANVPCIKLPEQGQLKKCTDNPMEFDPSAKMWFTWDENNLYIAAQVHDEVFSPAGQYYWLGDCIQLSVSSAESENNNQWYSYGIYKNISDLIVRCDSTISAYGTNTGVLQDAKFQFYRDEQNKNTVYKVAIPWNDLKPIKEQNGIFGLSVLISSNNGSERSSMLEWGKGIDGIRDAYYFVPAQLVQDAPIPVTGTTLN